jgi:hypothetical protein
MHGRWGSHKHCPTAIPFGIGATRAIISHFVLVLFLWTTGRRSAGGQTIPPGWPRSSALRTSIRMCSASRPLYRRDDPMRIFTDPRPRADEADDDPAEVTHLQR